MNDAAVKPRKRNADRTRAAILNAATTEFATKGFDGARVDEIAQRAGANKNLIYHYFGSKDKLFTAVLERMYETIRGRQGDTDLRGLAPETAMRRLIRATFDVFIDEPEFVWLLASENLQHARHVRESAKIIAMYNPLLETLQEILRHGAAEGTFRGKIDPVDLYISITALIYHYISNQHTLGTLFKTQLLSPRRRRQRRKHVEDMVMRFLRR